MGQRRQGQGHDVTAMLDAGVDLCDVLETTTMLGVSAVLLFLGVALRARPARPSIASTSPRDGAMRRQVWEDDSSSRRCHSRRSPLPSEPINMKTEPTTNSDTASVWYCSKGL